MIEKIRSKKLDLSQYWDVLSLELLDKINWDFEAEREYLLDLVSAVIEKTTGLLTETQRIKHIMIEKYPELERHITVNNWGVTVETSIWKMYFAFNHLEWQKQQYWWESPNHHYSKKEFKALIELFWDSVAPYVEILGMVWDSYWTSTEAISEPESWVSDKGLATQGVYTLSLGEKVQLGCAYPNIKMSVICKYN